MVVKSNFKQKNYFCYCLSRNTLLVFKNPELALGTKRDTHNCPFLPQFKNKKQQKPLITTFLLAQKTLIDITRRNDSIGTALINNI